ncbi:MAG: GNAT family N-acetyltransferase, partial [Glaciimonas sp.]|nr:GNAT family N-acetyltransferase [Glaciimonas sp.]
FNHLACGSFKLMAIAKELRGQGYGSKLYQAAKDVAMKEGKDYMCGFIWACFPDSLINMTRKDWVVTDCIHFQDPIKIPLLYVQKKAEYTAMKDYFQSIEYTDTKNMLLG